MFTYFRQVQVVIEEFERWISTTITVEKSQKQRHMLFIVLTLVGLPTHLDSVCDQILASRTIPTIDKLFSHLLHLVTSPKHTVVSSPTVDYYVLPSQITKNRTSQFMEN